MKILMHESRDDHILSPNTLLWVRGQALQDCWSLQRAAGWGLSTFTLSLVPVRSLHVSHLHCGPPTLEHNDVTGMVPIVLGSPRWDSITLASPHFRSTAVRAAFTKHKPQIAPPLTTFPGCGWWRQRPTPWVSSLRPAGCTERVPGQSGLRGETLP